MQRPPKPAMSTVRWYFGAAGFMIDIVNGEGNESQITGQMPVDEMNLKFELLPAAAPPTTAASSTSTSYTPMNVEPGCQALCGRTSTPSRSRRTSASPTRDRRS